MQRGSFFLLSGKILVLEYMRNLLSHNDSDLGLELETLLCSVSYGCCAAKINIYALCRPFDDR